MNDAVVLVLTPLVVAVCRARRLNPVPFLMATAMASNAGSAATITGNPQNVLIGLHSGITFGKVLLALLPVAAVSAAVLVLLTRRLYRSEMGGPKGAWEKEKASLPLQAPVGLRPSAVVVALVVAAFIASPWLHLELSTIALIGAVAALATSRSWPTVIFAQVNWVLLLFFAALFVVIFGAVHAGLFDAVVQRVQLQESGTGIAMLHGASLVMAQVVGNVPFTMLMLPVLGTHSPDSLWLSLAAGATLAGNLTLMGFVANLIVAESASQLGVKIGFWEFLRLGLPVTLVTTLVSIGVLWVEYALGCI